MKYIIVLILAMASIAGANATNNQVESVKLQYVPNVAVVCGTLQVCDLEFEKGEAITDFKLGDTQNWSINPASTGDERNPTAHLIVLPVAGALKTSLWVSTTKRKYELVLESNNIILASRNIAFNHLVSSDKIHDISKLKSYVQESPSELAVPGQPLPAVVGSQLAITESTAARIVQSIDVAPVAAPVKAAPVVHEWKLKPEHQSLRDVIEDWASNAGIKGQGYDVIWESRDFPLAVKQVKTISTGDFFDALRLLGEAYRNSDAPFQIQPTAFNQIVVQPMNKAQR